MSLHNSNLSYTSRNHPDMQGRREYVIEMARDAKEHLFEELGIASQSVCCASGRI